MKKIKPMPDAIAESEFADDESGTEAAFHHWLDTEWPLWKGHRGSTHYHELHRAFGAGQATRPEALLPKWISVGDHLPGYEYDGDVLTVSLVSKMVSVRTGRYLTALANEAKQNKEECAVTHWMPMPQAPVSPLVTLCPYPIQGDDGSAKDCISKDHCGCDERKP